MTPLFSLIKGRYMLPLLLSSGLLPWVYAQPLTLATPTDEVITFIAVPTERGEIILTWEVVNPGNTMAFQLWQVEPTNGYCYENNLRDVATTPLTLQPIKAQVGDTAYSYKGPHVLENQCYQLEKIDVDGHSTFYMTHPVQIY
jgi:hypothetical protein